MNDESLNIIMQEHYQKGLDALEEAKGKLDDGIITLDEFVNIAEEIADETDGIDVTKNPIGVAIETKSDTILLDYDEYGVACEGDE